MLQNEIIRKRLNFELLKKETIIAENGIGTDGEPMHNKHKREGEGREL